ncbi:MAG: GNAT family N-acetyltransferase [Burkholderiaceae bacterium]|nr:GNAT family N-acetyltransferase [Burkholderiaceae bacterium]
MTIDFIALLSAGRIAPRDCIQPVAAARLALEPQRAEHAQAMFEVLGDPALYEYENTPPVSLDALRERYGQLESRVSPNGAELWLNWVLRLTDGPLIGYVQATLRPQGRAAIAYELGSAWWGRGLATEAVQAMVDELAKHYQVRHLFAVHKHRNQRSHRLLLRLGFTPCSAEEHAQRGVDGDELLMQKQLP